MSSWLENTKDVAQILAYVAAALFLAYKLYSGWFIIDVSIKLECRRDRSRQGDWDYLSATVIVKKGERGAIKLHDVRVTIFDSSNGQIIGRSQQAKGLRRLQFIPGTEEISERDRGRVGEVQPDVIEATARLLNLAPGDEMQFAALFEVGADQACVVEAVLLGRRFFPFQVTRYRLQRILGISWSQWRASSVSPPLNS